MENFIFTETGIPGLTIIEPKVFGDERGYFMETYSERAFIENGLSMKFVQDNESCSRRGVLRGLHFQTEHPQGKLLRVVEGEIFDVAVDMRKNSETFGKWYGLSLSAQNKKQFYVPEQFAHGFLVLSERAVVQYKTTDFYYPQFESGIAWDSEILNIDWPISGMEIVLSDKDKSWRPEIYTA